MRITVRSALMLLFFLPFPLHAETLSGVIRNVNCASHRLASTFPR